jgi:NADH:ubiquinone oxidoreductase subunit 6 (subunit J)
MIDYGEDYYQVVVIVGAVIAVLAIIHAIIWVNFERKERERRDGYKQKRS